MKKLLLGLGAVAAVAAPVAAVVACGTNMGDSTINTTATSTKTLDDAKAAASDATNGLAKATTLKQAGDIMGIDLGTSTNAFVSATFDEGTKKLTTNEKMTGDVTMNIKTIITITFATPASA